MIKDAEHDAGATTRLHVACIVLLGRALEVVGQIRRERLAQQRAIHGLGARREKEKKRQSLSLLLLLLLLLLSLSLLLLLLLLL